MLYTQPAYRLVLNTQFCQIYGCRTLRRYFKNCGASQTLGVVKKDSCNVDTLRVLAIHFVAKE